MAKVKICACHSDMGYCDEIARVFQEHDSDLDVSKVNDLRTIVPLLATEKPDIVVFGVDSPDDPALRTVDIVKNSKSAPGIVVVSHSPSQELLVACLRAGCDEFLELPVKKEELSKALSTLYRKRGIARGKQGRVTAVYTAKGGSGATSLACNLAAGVARALQSETASCILDLNLEFGAVVLFMDVREFSYSLADACRDSERLDPSLLRSYMSEHESGASVLPAPLTVEDLDHIEPQKFSTVVQVCRQVYDHVFMDLSHSIDGLTLLSMDLADEVFVLCDMVLPGIRNTIRAVKMFKELDYDKSKLKLVINRYYKDAQVSLEEASEYIGLPIYWLVPYDSQVAIAAANSGQGFFEASRASQVSESVQALARDIAGLSVKKPTRKRGIFGLRA